MMSDKYNDTAETPADIYIRRSRVEHALGEAVRNPLVYVIAGVGCGKTRAVEAFLKTRNEWRVDWLQLSDNDNTGAWYWEHVTHVIAQHDPKLAARLREMGFPDTDVKLKRFCTGMTAYRQEAGGMLCIVLDDFHHLTERQVLDFHERFINAMIPHTRIIVISRKEPNINIMPVLSKDKVSVIGEEVLRFTQEEIAEFLTYQSVPFSYKRLPEIHSQTQGWALAVRLLEMSLKRIPDDEPLASRR